jgi:4,5-dihydroxyphthalate decarboxylase
MLRIAAQHIVSVVTFFRRVYKLGEGQARMDDLSLTAALRRYEYNDALFDERPHDGLILKIARYEGALLNAMRSMLHERAYDVCEMSPSSYVIARQGGAPIIGLPIFPFCQYPLSQIVVRADSAIVNVGDLGRATVAVRTWAQPTALWARQYLMDYLGIDLSGVRWIFVADDPVPGLRRPEGSIERRGETLESLLLSGQADAVIGLHQVPSACRKLIDDPEGAAAKWTRDTGVVPANHLLVIDARHRGTAAADLVCNRVEAVVRAYLDSGILAAGVIGDLRRINPFLAPLPSGREDNARMWQTLVAAMVRQGMISPIADPMDLLHDWEPGPSR